MNARLAAPDLPKLDKYELIEEIGHGGMATVYRALDKRLGREVAVKIIHKHLRENPEVATRFVAEARAAAKLRHPNIVDVYDVSDEAGGERYLVVELLRGETLRKILQQRRDMPAEIGAAIVLELCDALERAHACGVVHRDVKPENVLVELPADRARADALRDGERSSGAGTPSSKPGDGAVTIKLTDFGIAKILDAQGVTSTGQVLGSPAHMAPEQIEGGDVDARTDVFALGVLLYEALVGHLPFEGKNPAQVLRRVLDGSFAAADRERPSVGGRWARVVARALARDAADRTKCPTALADEIRGELDALGITDPPAEIRAYFADPEAYTARHPGRVVPRLIARADAARKRGDVPGAAADLNRALALSPNDAAILKRVASLSSSASRALVIRRAAVVAGGSLALGLAAFGVARLQQGSAAEDSLHAPLDGAGGELRAPTTPAATDPAPASESAAPVIAQPPPSADRKPPRIVLPSSVVAPTRPSAAPELRRVKLSIVPKGVELKIDGRLETSWFTRDLELSVGTHLAEVKPMSPCCKAQSRSFQVKETSAEDPQKLVIRLDVLPSTVSLAGAPLGAQCACSGIGLVVTRDGPATITLPEVVWSGRCTFTAPSLASAVTSNVSLKAGEPNAIPWPG
jgi:serine/threonine-protein kinase